MILGEESDECLPQEYQEKEDPGPLKGLGLIRWDHGSTSNNPTAHSHLSGTCPR